jgi:hypothetical protein
VVAAAAAVVAAAATVVAAAVVAVPAAVVAAAAAVVAGAVVAVLSPQAAIRVATSIATSASEKNWRKVFIDFKFNLSSLGKNYSGK